MNLTQLTVRAFLERLRSSEPTPGGGSAAALASALGASLLAMVGGMPGRLGGSADETGQLQAAHRQCVQASDDLTALVDDDSRAYDEVVAAFKLPKSGDREKSERSARIQSALKAAVDAPLAVAQRSVDALEMAGSIARFGNPNAASDTGVAVELLTAGIRGAALNVEINLQSVKDQDFVQRSRRALDALAARADRAASDARRHLDRR